MNGLVLYLIITAALATSLLVERVLAAIYMELEVKRLFRRFEEEAE